MSLSAGTRLGPYQILGLIGAGGMGEVYQARDTRLDRRVAIKVLPADLSADPDRRARFEREARSIAGSAHPHICTLHDVGEAAGSMFLVMEHLDGDTLAHRLEKGPLAIEQALTIATEIAEALTAAHRQGIVHRDLKPANVMLTKTGAKLLDFGVAKLTGHGEQAATAHLASVPTRASLTGEGVIVGTLQYMAPEQVEGKPADARADLWALGAILYEMVTGKRAFEATSAASLIGAILEREPAPLSTLQPLTPPGIDRLVRQCLAKEPDDRPDTAHDVANDLRWLREASSVGTTAGVRLTRRARVWTTLLVVGGVAVGAGAGWLVSRQAATTAPATQQPLVRFSTSFEPTGQPGEFDAPRLAVAPDGRTLIYVGKGASGGVSQLHLRRMDRLDVVALAGTEGATAPFFSADGGSVAFFAGGLLKKVTLGDGVVETLGDATVIPRTERLGEALAWGGAWAPGDTMFFSAPAAVESPRSLDPASFRGSGLMRVSSSGGSRAEATKLGPGEAVHRWPSLTPDGRVVVYTTSNSTGPGLEEPHIVAESLASGTREVLPVEATYALFAPGGRHLLLVRRGSVMAVAFDADRLNIRGSPVPIMDGVIQASTGAAQLAVSPSALASLQGASETRRLVWVDRQGRVEPIDAPPRLYVHPRLSPDGAKIVVAITEPSNDIWTYDLSRGTLSRVTFEGSNAYPIWTRDSRRIAYVSSRQGHPPNAFWKSADGNGAEERLLTSPNTQVTETWTPDGQTLLFVELRPPPTGWDILTLSLDGPRQPIGFLETTFTDATPQISPTGRFVAHGSTETGIFEIFVHSFPNPKVKVQVSSGGGHEAAWRADERELYFRVGDAMMVADVSTSPELRVGKPRVLFRGPFATIQGKNYDVTPDGQRFLMVRVDEPAAPKGITVVLNWMEDLKSRLLSK